MMGLAPSRPPIEESIYLMRLINTFSARCMPKVQSYGKRKGQTTRSPRPVTNPCVVRVPLKRECICWGYLLPKAIECPLRRKALCFGDRFIPCGFQNLLAEG